ncbi:hypothetical protein A5634_18820 [Mycobacterium asiaticum]|uniref:Uncharacterized protein n=1 Tax=Mycobacterium asiaticum TaxID=1790 RepID=A0A1A3P972_MYCAS|nr:hypothetical protein [Mycobacterium asiaticum]OBK29142.1 hypothetical protein A5634_18820 [Mycobacterium asiaticum]
MNPDAFCTSDEWSGIAAASSTSQLAGVLGGFLITAIALLFDRSGREGAHTLALFSSAVLILMLDSYLFSLISGIHPSETGDRQGICAITWTQDSLATGMLAAGTTGLFGGLGWMLASHAVNKAPKQDPSEISAYCFVAELGGWLTFGAAMTTTLIMSETSIDYLHLVLGHRPSLWLTGTIVTFCALAILLDFAVVYIRTKALNRSLKTAEPTQLALRSIKIATVGTLFLAVAASWLAVSLARLPVGWLTTPNRAFVLLVFVLSLFVPTVISTAICYSVASTDEGLRLRSRR